jgi:hypothetical protein
LEADVADDDVVTITDDAGAHNITLTAVDTPATIQTEVAAVMANYDVSVT